MEKMPVGIMTWVLSDPFKAVELAKSVGVKTMQLGCPTDEYYTGEKKREFLSFLRDSGIDVTAVFCGYKGEEYSSFDSVVETVGLRNPKYREERVKKTLQISDFARDVRAKAIGGHIGVIPEDRKDPDYTGLVQATKQIASYIKKNMQYFALETGLETSKVLIRFIRDVGADNVRVNFDPANILHHGLEDPIDALEALKKYVASVHCKDFKMPSKNNQKPVEVPFGEGDVGGERFLRKLKEIGYLGPLSIERESQDPEEQKKGMIKAKENIEQLRARIVLKD